MPPPGLGKGKNLDAMLKTIAPNDRAYVSDAKDPNAAQEAPGQPWNYYMDPGKFGNDHATKADADAALKAGIFYGTGYEGSAAIQRPQTQEDFAVTQMYANQDAITAMGFDPSVINLLMRNGGSALASIPGGAVLGEYSGSRPQGMWDQFRGASRPDIMSLPASDIGTGEPVAFSPRVAAHESTHRGLDQMVDAVFGRAGPYMGIGGSGKQPWVDTSKFSPAEMNALTQLKTIVDSQGGNHAENEWLTRMVEARLTGDPGTMLEVDPRDAAGGYKRMTPEDQTRMTSLLQNLETAAQKIVAQRHPGGPK